MYDKQFDDRDYSNSTFLVSGGAGFIGANIVEYLLKYNAAKVKVLDNLLTGSYENVKAFQSFSNYEFIEGDIRDLEKCREAVQGADYILHQAALGSVPRSIQHPEATNSINVDGFLNMLIAATEAKVKRFVYASSSSVYGDNPDLPKKESKIGQPMSPYAVSKYTNELYAHVYSEIHKMEIIGLRYFNVFGPRQSPKGAYAAVIPLFIQNMMNDKPVFIDGDGLQTRDFTFVENAVQANIKALFSDDKNALGQVFNVAVGENFSVMELFETIKNMLGSEAEAIHRPGREGDIKNSLADISKAEKLLNYRPQVRFGEGIRQTIAYFKEQPVSS